MNLPNNQTISLSAAAVCAGLIAVAILYFQNYLGLEPCYLCMTQRVFVIAVGVIFLAAGLHNPAATGQKIYAGLATLAALGGSFFSIKQLWLQGLPEDQVPACGPPVDYLFDAFSVSEAISMLLRGDGNCAEVQWQLLGISMPGWVLVSFIALAGVGLLQLLRK
ncbi:disulfide bond formation protein B [Porticoccaceae bacterium]|nr:disulfide bond formation protein B [Porticoccaceae bacterium]MDB9805487.1 disulfide bond formation protein B [Porticoccaceae bacterium]MDB9949194.1 disulfide bond formation protein B [Porticoccaceae bacterium]